jgi:hypothetical protein
MRNFITCTHGHGYLEIIVSGRMRRDRERSSKPKGRRLIGRATHWSVENIKIPVRGTGSGGMDCTDVAQHSDHLKALLNMVISLWVPFIHFIFFKESYR